MRPVPGQQQRERRRQDPRHLVHRDPCVRPDGSALHALQPADAGEELPRHHGVQGLQAGWGPPPAVPRRRVQHLQPGVPELPSEPRLRPRARHDLPRPA